LKLLYCANYVVVGPANGGVLVPRPWAAKVTMRNPQPASAVHTHWVEVLSVRLVGGPDDSPDLIISEKDAD
jgi:hypothetical protein